MFKRLTLAAAALALLAFAPQAQTSAIASDGVCGHYAFAGAFKSRGSANRQASKIGGQVYDLDASDSPNAGKGFWVVGIGPGPRNWANKQARKFRSRGAKSYVAARCMWG